MFPKRKFAIMMALVISYFHANALAAPAVDDHGTKVKDMARQEDAVEIENKLSQQQSVADVHFQLKDIRIVSQLKTDEAVFDKIKASYINKTVTLAELDGAAAQITRYFRSHGYPAAAAYIPEQKISDGVLCIDVTPGRYGNISINNESRLKMSVIEQFTSGLKSGDIITAKKLETVLYGIGDSCGVKTAGILSPGKNVGTSDITIRIVDGKGESTILYSENYGSASSGRYQYGIVTDFYNIGGNGDHANLTGIISNENLHNYAVNYEKVIGNSGTKLGFRTSRMDYELGDIFRTLGAEGQTDTFSVYAMTPLWQMTDSGLHMNYGWDYRRLKDEYKNFSAIMTKRHSNAFHIGAAGYERNGEGNTDYDLTLYMGKLGLDSEYAKFSNVYTHTEGNYIKAVLNISRVQVLDKYWDILVKIQEQKASRNLDSSEQVYLGGADGVRAYPRGEGSGDEGYQSTAEFRYHTKMTGLTLSTYFDTGHVKTAKDGSQGADTLSGWGIGISYSQPNNYFLRFDYARRIGLADNPSTDDKVHSRLWFIAGKIL